MATLSQKKLVESIKLIEREWIKMHKALARSRCGEIKEVRYKYVEMIGKGSFGVVVKIMDDRRNFFALKRVYQDRRYHNRELGILMEVDHPNIVKLVSYFHTDKTPSGMYLNIITDFVGINLEEYIKENRNTETGVIRSVYKQILEGLKYLHGKSICHRDIKPSNILIGPNGLVKICDLGSAKMIGRGERNITYICSRFYRAPENLLDYKEYDFRIDIWSVGCVIAEFRHPGPMFKGGTSGSTLNKILEIVRATQDDLIELGCQKPDYKPGMGVRKYLEKFFEEPELLDVLEKALTFSPCKRPTASELLSRQFFQAPEK
ncbi:serine/threonine kinase [Encephalitozoon hellem ATCC 50504]|uniref:Glycogen synthase kinase-3 beta n=1 Tax=Encephalitozoon hellem TaxID=27973 RepID=A0A9Q9FBV0_ENCHE|nr:serine/threonine kinase [Encephalitozoon hellem ATCC 50504]AFM98651.1 serine/threonine kinase [Encephalitozoon hellem ATCC 50504]UTX43600.1 glycogen synthase kinase-3 beta [Encephalitozoon hellem]WEL39075.1 protein kinase domain-containing protein [Encephalitozoon hellem]|eukprot:XP_003887632.1 serine/threonine kinase [Encephalitozoon hellem ATCC 50504]